MSAQTGITYYGGLTSMTTGVAIEFSPGYALIVLGAGLLFLAFFATWDNPI